jgi:chromosome segregation ATPase
MAPRSQQADGIAVAQQLGRLTEAIDRARDDRREVRDEVSKLHDGLDAIRGLLAGLTQTANSTAQQVAMLSLEKCGERLDKLEGTVFSENFQTSTTRLERLESTISGWQKLMGTGRAFAVKVTLALISAGALGAGAEKIASHL